MEQKQEQQYVFVVCGGWEHIQTLNYTIQFLKHYTQKKIWVVTDSSRNEGPIHHDAIIDVSTPENFTNHQAAIYLKTSLHRIVDLKKGLYCYLDTDIFAINENVDQIFESYHAPITFCTDHCRMMAFAPSAINDPKYEDLVVKQKQLYGLYDELYQEAVRNNEVPLEHLEKIKQIKDSFHQKRPFYGQSISKLLNINKGFKKYFKAIQVVIARLFFQLFAKSFWIWHYGWAFLYSIFSKKEEKSFIKRWKARGKQQFNKHFEQWHQGIYKAPFSFQNLAVANGYRFEAETGKWFNLEGKLLYEENLIIRKVEAMTSFSWNYKKSIWQDENGSNLSIQIGTDMLRVFLNDKFQLNINDSNFQHWNGGVFLFDEQSYDFLERWYEWTMEIFNDPRFKVRDQGTLIATVWAFKLENHPTLPLEFNFITDYFHPTMTYQGDFIFDLHANHKGIAPKLLHIYHHFGDRSWKVWRDVEALGASLGIKYEGIEEASD